MKRSLKQRSQLRGYLLDHKNEEECLRPFYRYGQRTHELNKTSVI